MQLHRKRQGKINKKCKKVLFMHYIYKAREETLPAFSVFERRPSQKLVNRGDSPHGYLVKACRRALGGCLPPAAGHPLSVFHRSGCAPE